jgi:hypothetical protein
MLHTMPGLVKPVTERRAAEVYGPRPRRRMLAAGAANAAGVATIVFLIV